MIFRLNRWALGALIERDAKHRSRAEVARDAEIRRSTLTDVLNGRRDASEDVMARIAAAIEVDPRSIASDPFGALPPLLDLLKASRELAPHLNGHDFGLRAAVEACDEAGL